MYILGGLAGLLILMILPVMTSIVSSIVYTQITGIHLKDLGPVLGINVVIWFFLFGFAAYRSEVKARRRREESGKASGVVPCEILRENRIPRIARTAGQPTAQGTQSTALRKPDLSEKARYEPYRSSGNLSYRDTD